MKKHVKSSLNMMFGHRVSMNLRAPCPAVTDGKAIIGREVDRDPDLLIAAQPTRGFDVGAIEFIRKRLIDEDGGRPCYSFHLN